MERPIMFIDQNTKPSKDVNSPQTEVYRAQCNY